MRLNHTRPDLLRLLKGGPWDAQRMAARALGEIGALASTAVPALRRSTTHADSDVRTVATAALRAFNVESAK
ncbi:MAG: HEAT repeat domain-containing protein [Planctomycetaceae bacterium]|nr:HEAT repeat domain-containing protein [Planctomycetaceae bacterium]